MVSTPARAGGRSAGSVQRRVAPGVHVARPSVRTNRAPEGMTSVTVTPAAALGPWLATVTSYDVSRSTTPKAGPVIVSAMSAWHGRDVQRRLGRAGVLALVAPAVVVGVGLDDAGDEQRGAVERLRHRAELVRTRSGRRRGWAGAPARRWRSSIQRPSCTPRVQHGRRQRDRRRRAPQRPAHEHAVDRRRRRGRGSGRATRRACLPSGVRAAVAPNVTAARAPAGTSSSTPRRASENRTAMTAL